MEGIQGTDVLNRIAIKLKFGEWIRNGWIRIFHTV